MRRTVRPSKRRQRGAALLLAMLILTLVATLAAGMVWQQSRGIDVEAAERTRAQADWLLGGALDWGRLILREDARNGGPDHLGEPWATPLAESRLSTFLAAGRTKAGADGGGDGDGDEPAAFLSGRIVDAQSRYNLRNLAIADPAQALKESKALQRLCAALGLAADTATRIAQGLRASRQTTEGAVASTAGDPDDGAALLMPQDAEQLGWYGLDPDTVRRLVPYVELLPLRTALNANTAPAEALMAAIEGLDRGGAERLVQARQRKPFAGIADLQAALPPGVQADPAAVGVASQFFEVNGQLRLEGQLLRERTLVQRRGLDVVVLQRERLAADASAAP